MAWTLRIMGLAGALLLWVYAGATDLTPTQLRLSWTGDPRSSMTVMWQTGKEAGSVVEYGETERLGRSITGKTVTYQYQTGILHEATVTGLKPDTTYWYRAGSQDGG